jgi:hypothetical protein
MSETPEPQPASTDDFELGKACSIDNPDCESCQ